MKYIPELRFFHDNTMEQTDKINRLINSIKNKIISLLDSKEIIAYESMNELFDPELHEAVMVKKSSKKSNTVIEEFEKGYNYKNRVLRHAKVVVSE